MAATAHDHHSHDHHIDLQGLNKAFVIGIVLNLFFVFVELGAGFWLDSLALISDAGHNLSDVFSLMVAMIAFRLMKLKPNVKYTYGYKKSTVLASLLNACILLVAIGIILAESIKKISDPQPIEGGAIAWVAGVGIVINAFTAWLFRQDQKKDLNVQGADLQMVADTLVSVGVVVCGLVMQYTGWYIIDSVISIVIATVILVSTMGLLFSSLRLSLDGVPEGIDVPKIKELIVAGDQRIVDIHHLHIWAISTSENALTAHIVVRALEGMETVKHNVKHLLEDHRISHVTLEFEVDGECDCDET
jgi:cobalt-zinc-cadmium efflux system protein